MVHYNIILIFLEQRILATPATLCTKKVAGGRMPPLATLLLIAYHSAGAVIPVEIAMRFQALIVLIAMMRATYCFSSKCSLT